MPVGGETNDGVLLRPSGGLLVSREIFLLAGRCGLPGARGFPHNEVHAYLNKYVIQ